MRKDFDDSGFRCESHPTHSYRAIYYGENCPHIKEDFYVSNV